ncbi:MAG: ABC transporter permease [Planctomycetota bacterium]
MTFLRCTWWIAVQGFGMVFKRRATLLFVFAVLGYAFLTTLLLARFADQQNPNGTFAELSLYLFVQVVVPITAVYFGVVATREEVSDGTLLHVLVRPVPRPAIWAGKYLAALLVSVALLGTGYGLACALAPSAASEAGFGQRLRPETLAVFALPMLFGTAAYVAVGCWLGLRFKWAILIGLGFVAAWEQFVSTAPHGSGVRSLTILDATRTLIFHAAEGQDVLRRAILDMSWADTRFDMEARMAELPTAGEAARTLLVFVVLPLALCLWTGARREFVSAEKE